MLLTSTARQRRLGGLTGRPSERASTRGLGVRRDTPNPATTPATNRPAHPAVLATGKDRFEGITSVTPAALKDYRTPGP